MKLSTLNLVISIICVLFTTIVHCTEFENPYKVLGISKTASNEEIKKAYKSLVKIWHPDKNSAPEANEKFMSIKQAYELLSNPLKKERFDKYGTVDETHQNDFHNHFHQFKSYFQHFNEYSYQGFQEEEKFLSKHRISYRYYSNNILPKTYKKPYLIYAYSSYCYICFKKASIWKDAVQDLEPLGYGIATVNDVFDGDLLDNLRVPSLPSILVVVEGRIIHFRTESSLLDSKMIRHFALNAIPTHFITRINDYPALRRFLDQWEVSNKISILILSQKENPRMRHLLNAMQFSTFAKFGYFYLTDSTDSKAIKSALNIQYSNHDHIMIFNDNPQNGPVARLVLNSGSKRQEMEQIINLINHHKFLSMPRISSTEYFDEICPVSSRSYKQICVILPVMESDADKDFIKTFRRFVIGFKNTLHNENFHFSYIYINQQWDFMEKFTDLITPSDNEKDGKTIDILVLWRYENDRTKVMWLPDAWTNDESKISIFADSLLNNLDKVVAGSLKLTKTAKIIPLKDEYYPSWFTRFSHNTIRAIEMFWYHFTKKEALPVLSATFTFIFILFIGYLLNYLKPSLNKTKVGEKDKNKNVSTEYNWHPDDPKISKKGTLDGSRQVLTKEQKCWKDMEPLLHELRAETYYGMIRLLKPGCRSLVILVDEESKDILLKQFATYVWPLRNNKTFSFGYLMVNKNLSFFRLLLEHTLPAQEGDGTNVKNSMVNRLKDINPKQTLGTVIAICGWKLYFSMYHPMHVNPRRRDVLGFDDSDEYTESENEYENNTTDGRSRRHLLRHVKKNCAIKLEEVLDGLPNWIDRVLEGSIRRYYIPEWPENLK
uniref:J domain-containing protein n=1 Tax=Strongyloides stercoralis TaxID=6248 RepID=A0A0K0E766_STRER